MTYIIKLQQCIPNNYYIILSFDFNTISFLTLLNKYICNFPMQLLRVVDIFDKKTVKSFIMFLILLQCAFFLVYLRHVLCLEMGSSE